MWKKTWQTKVKKKETCEKVIYFWKKVTKLHKKASDLWKKHKILESTEKKIINLWKIESHKHSESSQQNWTYSQTSEKISLPSVIKWQKITNYCKKDTNFWKKWPACEKKRKS